MRGKRLALGFVVVENPNFAADELSNPDRAGVCLCASPADVPKRPYGHQRIARKKAYATVLLRFGERSRVVGAGNHCHEVTFPNVLILTGTLLFVLETLDI